ncbi:MAG: hypothetical protein K8W52_25975 [Deltaproteobacteria bacterium]|nr:hypothetical protein [Deltaproteobacteria bacterium]
MIAVLGTLGIVIAFVVIGVLVDRKVPLLPRSEDLEKIGKPVPLVHAAGTAPESALVGTAAELEAHLAARRCACKGKLARTGPDEALRYDGRVIVVVPLTCAKCGAHHRAYAALTAGPPAG